MIATQIVDAPFSSRCLIAYLYFAQGICLTLPSTIVLTYLTLPSYTMIGWFEAATLPFSFKFITAPLIEKYTSIGYGRRKTWVVISLLISSVLLFILSGMLEAESEQLQAALLLTFTIFLVSLEDISTDALAIKELQCPKLVSLLQSLFQQLGIVFGSIIFLKLISVEFGTALGLDGAIISKQTFFRFVAVVFIASVVFIHLLFKEKNNPKENDGSEPLSQIISHYRHFVNLKYSAARQCITFLILGHGLNYFLSGYTIELIKNGFPKEQLSLISNLCIIPSFIASYLLSKVTQIHDLSRMFRYAFAGKFLVCLLIYLINFQVLMCSNQLFSCVSLVLISLANSCYFFVASTINNTFADSEYSGLMITMMASMHNLGNNSTLQLNIISQIGYNTASHIGLSISAVTLLGSNILTKWVEKGEIQQKKHDEDKTQ